MFTMCILFSTLTITSKGICKGALKTIFRPQKLYRAGTAPLGSKIPGSATAYLKMQQDYKLSSSAQATSSSITGLQTFTCSKFRSRILSALYHPALKIAHA